MKKYTSNNNFKNHIITFCFLILNFFISNLSNAQEIIPFNLTKYNSIILDGFVNEKDSVKLMFQIAMKDAALSPQRINKAESIVFKDDVSNQNTLKIGKLNWENIKFYDNELAGHGADGKIGTVLFKGKSFKIDYDLNQFEIYDNLPAINDYTKLPFTQNEYGQIFITCKSTIGNETHSADFLLQSGYSGGLLYSNAFTDNNNLDSKLKTTGEKTLKNAANQSITTKQGVLPKLEIGSITLKHVSAGFFMGSIKNQTFNYLGADVLKRFNWIFDMKNQVVYIKPNKRIEDAYFEIM